MKKLLLIFAVFALCNCRVKPQSEILRDSAIDNVDGYLAKKLNDPSSYKTVGYGQLKSIDNNFGVDSIKGPYKTIGYSIEHSYRAKNEFGAVILYDQKFIMDTTLAINEVRNLPE